MKKSLSPLLLALAVNTAYAEDYVIHAGQLIDGHNDKPYKNISIIVEDDKITDIKAGFIAPANEQELIDLSAKTVLPGLIDTHTHLTLAASASGYTEPLSMNAADFALRGAHKANQTLMIGFTTVRDLGDYYASSLALRNAINKGYVPGPRVYTSGKAISSTGGHADQTNGYAYHLRGPQGPEKGIVNSPDDAREAVRLRFKNGADVIKVTATGGVLSLNKSSLSPQFTNDELSEIIATAHEYGMSVAVHGHGKEGIRRAVLAGADSIEHGTQIDEEIIALMKERGTYYVPTLIAGQFVVDMANKGFLPEVIKPKALSVGPLMQATFKKVYESGVNIAFGTDTGVNPFGKNGKEFALMVNAGMSPMEAIQSATLHASKLMKIDDMVGTIEANKKADIIAVDSDPLADITSLETVSFVMKDGKIYKNN